MTKTSFLLILFCISVTTILCFAQQAPRITTTAKFFTVHVDEIEPAYKDRFEELNTKQMQTRNKIYKEHQIDIPPGFEYAASGGKYYSLRPKSSYSELDQTMNFSDEVKKLITEKVSPYSDTMHEMLRYHHNEIWSIDTSVSYLPKAYDPTKMTMAHIRIDMVVPKKSHLYDSVMTLFFNALKKIDSPMSLIGMYSSYGSGANIYIYHGSTVQDISDARNPKAFLIKAYGPVEAKKIIQLWYQCLFSYDALDATARPDMTDLQPGVMWLGVSEK